MRYRIGVFDGAQLTEALSHGEFEYIYAPVRLLSADIPDKERIIAVPKVFGFDRGDLDGCVNMGYSRALAHTIGHIPVIREAGMAIHGGFRLNITNSSAMEQYRALGLADTVLSVELSLNRVKSLKSSLPKGLIVYGRLPLMLLRNLPRFHGADGLTDRKGKFIPLIRGAQDEEEIELLNPNTLVLSDRMTEFACLDFAVLALSRGESAGNILRMYQNGADPKKFYAEYTRGLYYKQ